VNAGAAGLAAAARHYTRLVADAVSDALVPAVVFDRVTFVYPGGDGQRPDAGAGGAGAGGAGGAGGGPAVQDVSISVRAGERLGILGPNGGGKSTLLRLALGLLTPTSGTVRIMGLDPAAARRRGLIGYVPQKVEAEMGFPLSVRQVVTLGAAWRTPAWRPIAPAHRRAVETAMELCGAAPFADRPIGSLSGGQTQRAMIARALAAEPRVLVLDEPMVGIDALGQAQFAELLAKIHRERRITILIVSHVLRAIAAGSDRVACLSRRLHFHDSPAGLTPQVLAELFSHDVAGLGGTALSGMHIHAHGPGQPCPADHTHPHAHDGRSGGPRP